MNNRGTDLHECIILHTIPFLECMNYYILIIFGLVQRKLVPSDRYKLIIHKISGAQLSADNLYKYP